MSTRRRAITALYATLGGLVLLAAGWVLGNWMACTDEECSFDTDLFGAIGTWVGGTGTILALVFAGLQLSGDFEERARTRHEQEAARQAELQRAVEEAQYVAISAGMNGFSGGNLGTTLTGTVWNRANERPIVNVFATVPGFGEFRLLQVGPKKSDGNSWYLGPQNTIAAVPLPAGSSWDVWNKELSAASIVEFDMNGSRWRREGDAPTRRIGPAQG